jgi:hypothetical protein
MSTFVNPFKIKPNFQVLVFLVFYLRLGRILKKVVERNNKGIKMSLKKKIEVRITQRGERERDAEAGQ